jgi:hypothetical protein
MLFQNITFKISVRTSKRTTQFTITKINWLTLFKGIKPLFNRGFISLNSVNHLIFVMVNCGVLFKTLLNRGFIPLNSVNQLIFVMVNCGVLFEVRTEFLNII